MSVRPTYAQRQRLIEYLEDNPELARARHKAGRFQAKRKWEELSRILNSMGGLTKNSNQWSRFWTEERHRIKRQLVAHRNTFRVNNDLDDEAPLLPNLDDRMLLLVGGKKASRAKKAKKAKKTAPKRKKSPAAQPKQDAVATRTTQTKAVPLPRRSPRIRVRSRIQMNTERADDEPARAVDLHKDCRTLDKVAEAITFCGETIAKALRSLR